MRTTGESVKIRGDLLRFDGLAEVASVVGKSGSTANECLICFFAG